MAATIPQVLQDSYQRNVALLGADAAARSLPSNYEVKNGQIQVKPDSWLLKNGWTLPLAAIGGGLTLGALGGLGAGGGAAAMTGPTLAQAAGGASAAAAGSGAAGAVGAAGMGFSWGDAIKYGTELFGGLWGAHEQSKDADKSAQIQSDALKYSTDAQLAASREAQAATEKQSALDRATAEATRRGNYDQWLAHDQRVGSLGQLAGLPARVSPGYVPLPSAAGGVPSSGGMYPSSAANMPKPGEVDWSSPQLGSQLSAFFKSRGVSDAEVPYWVKEASNLVARGKEIGDPNYANMRLAAADIFGSAPSAAPRSTAPVAAQAPRTLLDYAQLRTTPALTGQMFLPPSLRA